HLVGVGFRNEFPALEFCRRVRAGCLWWRFVRRGAVHTAADGSDADNVAKWNGSSWSPLGSGITGGEGPGVFALTVSGSEVYAGGNFTTAGASPANNVAKWNGSSWTALGSGIDGNHATVNALAMSGDDVYAVGYFTTAAGNTVRNIAKWNGNTWSALG